MVDRLFAQLEESGFPSSKIALLGFSQGACLALEYAARHPRRYGALIGLSGGLIGPPGTAWNTSGSLEETQVFLGCSDADPHIPRPRVDETAQVLEKFGGIVTKRLYPNLGHTVNQDEIDYVRQMLQQI
jgi:predicted esterase